MKHNPLHQWQKEHNKRVKDFHKKHTLEIENSENGNGLLANKKCPQYNWRHCATLLFLTIKDTNTSYLTYVTCITIAIVVYFNNLSNNQFSLANII